MIGWHGERLILGGPHSIFEVPPKPWITPRQSSICDCVIPYSCLPHVPPNGLQARLSPNSRPYKANKRGKRRPNWTKWLYIDLNIPPPHNPPAAGRTHHRLEKNGIKSHSCRYQGSRNPAVPPKQHTQKMGHKQEQLAEKKKKGLQTTFLLWWNGQEGRPISHQVKEEREELDRMKKNQPTNVRGHHYQGPSWPTEISYGTNCLPLVAQYSR